MMKRLNPLLGVAILALTIVSGASDGGREATRIRLVSLETMLAAKRALLKDKWSALAQLDGQITDLIASEAPGPGDSDPRTAERVRDLLRAAQKRQALETERLQLLQGMQDLFQEIAGLREEIQRARNELQESSQVLEGRWTITLMPAGTRGEVYLSQNSTLVTGDYKLDSGLSGNLQGTFINNTLVLERIDSRYGKMGRFEGTLAANKLSVRGAWYSYDIMSGQPLSGAFVLERAQEEPTP
jgi:hypothetical protein